MITKATITGSTLTLVIDLDKEPKPSKTSGKSLMLHTSGGIQSIGCKYLGKDVKAGINIMIPNDAAAAIGG